jgi:hypothetical protein
MTKTIFFLFQEMYKIPKICVEERKKTERELGKLNDSSRLIKFHSLKWSFELIEFNFILLFINNS